ncbi:rhomboid family intramembrane serine protease [Pseudonocardia phyllosphaerae]|uniref:rhomboid family intramembrane serine protease n=1 Tax=Pseudonocardia phyllosphaerae TaxID=3390502 RepID=UPI00397B7BC1
MTKPESGRSGTRIVPSAPGRAAAVILLFTALLYVLEWLDQLSMGRLDTIAELRPRDADDLTGILTYPLLHAGWGHLAANTLPLLVFGFLALSAGFLRWVFVTAVIWLVSGIGTWLLSPAPVIGASGIIFGWFLFLLVRGFHTRSGAQIVLALVLFVFWGSLLWGVLPLDPRVSWQAHLFGAIGGVLAASWTARADRGRRTPTLGS